MIMQPAGHHCVSKDLFLRINMRILTFTKGSQQSLDPGFIPTAFSYQSYRIFIFTGFVRMYMWHLIISDPNCNI